MNMQGKVERFMVKQGVLLKGVSIVAGVSGGADSICLLYILYGLKNKYDMNIAVVHLNHGIRGDEAKRDSDFVEAFCKSLSLSCYTFEEDIPAFSKQHGMSLEEAGRKMRYYLFEKVRCELNADYIAVAHHKNDNEETILWNFFRGSGLKGLKGIESKRGNIIRPLLFADREEIEQFLLDKNLNWCKDSTNDSVDYTRNKIRLKVMPYLKREIHAKVGDNIIQTGKIAGEVDDYMNLQANDFIDSHVKKVYQDKPEKIAPNEPNYGYSSQGVAKQKCVTEVRIDLRAFISLHVALKKYVIRTLIEILAGRLKDITSRHIEDIVSLAEKGVGKSADLPYGIKATCTYDSLCLKVGQRTLSNKIPVNLNCTDKKISDLQCSDKVEISEFFYEKSKEIPKNMYTKWFDCDKIKNGVELRTRKAGDFIQVTACGGTKKLKDYFIDQKIPREDRDSILLFADGSHIMWIVGYRISELYKVTDSTKKIMQIKICYDKFTI